MRLIDLWPNDMVLVRDTLFCHDDHLYQIIFKSHRAWQKYGSDMNKLYLSVCTKFKSGLWPWPLTQQHGSCLRHIILSWWSFVPTYFVKSDHASYWPNPDRSHWSLCTKFKSGLYPWPLILWHGSCFTTHRLIMIIICSKLFSNPTMHNKVKGRTWTGFTGLCTKFNCGLWPWSLT